MASLSDGTIVLRAIASFCLEQQQQQEEIEQQQTNQGESSLVLFQIGQELKKGGSLTCRRLTQAKTNVSFHVWLQGNDKLALFAKHAFPYAMWHPDGTYDVQRTENEAAAMRNASKLFQQKSNKTTTTAAYYCPKVCFCTDIAETGSKILVTEWIHGTEPLANQFISGDIDMRVITAASQGLAILNQSPVKDPLFNDGIRPMMRSFWPQVKNLFRQSLQQSSNDDSSDRCIRRMKEIGEDEFGEMMNQVDRAYMQRTVLGHGDAHVYNLLVEEKRASGSFGELGNLAFCDWEMCFVGAEGRDIGFFQGFPLACALCHAACGSLDKTASIRKALESFWSTYADCLALEQQQLPTYRGFLAWTGLCLFPTYYLMQLFVDVWPLDGVSDETRKETLASMGVLGLKTMEWGYCNKEPDLTLNMLQHRFSEAVEAEVQHLSSLSRNK